MVVVVEYFVIGSSEKHSRYFPSMAAARAFCLALRSDPACIGVNIIR